MPRTRPRISTAEKGEYRVRLLRLKQMGIATGDTENLATKSDRFRLQQIDPGLARVYDLPTGELAAIVLAELTVLKSGVMIVDQQMTTAGDECLLELSDPREHEDPSFQDLIQRLYNHPPILLNDFLMERSVPLRPCQRRGVIFATGWRSDPAAYCEGPLLRLEFSLRDEQGNETYREFRCELDRSFRRKYERRQQELRPAGLPHDREGRFGMKVRPGDQISAPPRANVGGKRDATGGSQPWRPERSILATKGLYG